MSTTLTCCLTFFSHVFFFFPYFFTLFITHTQEKEQFERERARLKEEIARDKAERKARGGKLSTKLGVDGYNPSAPKATYGSGGPAGGGGDGGEGAAVPTDAAAAAPEVRWGFAS